ncbi:MAG: pitrilysin family protein [Pseudomonadota bacterium]
MRLREAVAACAIFGAFSTAVVPALGSELATENGVQRVEAPIAQPVYTFTLDNGMQALVIEDRRAPVVTHMVWYRHGAADEPWGKSGIAHLLEHLMFKGTDKIPEGAFSKVVAENGGQDNAFTSYDFTGYFQRIAADRLGIVMGMEADRMVNLRLTEEMVTTEIDVVLEERAGRTDTNPGSLLSEQMLAALYRNHPYGIPVIGWREEIEALSLADAEAFYDAYYAPDNAILVVAGDVSAAAVEALAEEHYGLIPASGIQPPARPQEPPHRAARQVHLSDDRVRQPYVRRLYAVPAYDGDEPRRAAALSMLSSILGDGRTSRLIQALTFGEEAPAIGTAAWYSPTARDGATFGVFAAPKPGVSLETVEAALDAELARIAADGPTEEELARIKNRARATLVYAQDNQASLARLYGAALAVGLQPSDMALYVRVFQEITAAEVQAAAQEWLVPERSVTGYLTRDEGEAG